MYPGSVMDSVGETHIRGILDAILSQGKIEGRLSALNGMPRTPVVGETWQLQGGYDDPVEIVAVAPSDDAPEMVAYRHTDCDCISPFHAVKGHVSERMLDSFLRLYEPRSPRPDWLIEQWQRIVESA
jgi:hypothetical protein